jgi:hypothetical protein
MAFYHQPETPDLVPFRDSPRCPKCQGDKPMKPFYRTYRTMIVTDKGFLPWTKTERAVRIPGEHLHMTCAICRFRFNMECAPPPGVIQRGAGADHPPEVVVDWDSLVTGVVSV